MYINANIFSNSFLILTFFGHTVRTNNNLKSISSKGHYRWQISKLNDKNKNKSVICILQLTAKADQQRSTIKNIQSIKILVLK